MTDIIAVSNFKISNFCDEAFILIYIYQDKNFLFSPTANYTLKLKVEKLFSFSAIFLIKMSTNFHHHRYRMRTIHLI